MVWRDMYCPVCGWIKYDVECQINDVIKPDFCGKCRSHVILKSVCNGGLKSRYRLNDWPSDPLWYSGQTNSRVSADTMHDDGSESPLEHKDGGVVGDGIMETDRRGERRDKIRHRMKRRAGKNTIYCGA